MRANNLSDLLKKGDRVAVSNITGREASTVSVVSQMYCSNIIGGWALGKAGQTIETPKGNIPVYATFDELLRLTPKEKHPNKILVYSPPAAVYGEVKEIVNHGRECVETIYIVTEHVSVEVTSKIYLLCDEADIDVIGCNTLGIINARDKVRIGAVGGDTPEETFQPGSVTIISNSGNMVNTIASYLQSAGMRISFGISTGKDRLILFPLKNLLKLAAKDTQTKLIVLYIEPGGTYEHDAIDMLQKEGFAKPVIVYIAGEIAEKHSISLGHAGAVVEGSKSSALAKKEAFDAYFGIDSYKPQKRYHKDADLRKKLSRGIRVKALHHIPKAVTLVVDILGLKKDKPSTKPLRLNPWFIRLGELGRHLPSGLCPAQGVIPGPYAEQFRKQQEAFLEGMIRQSMKHASHASSNDGRTPRIYGYSLMDIMKRHSFAATAILYWTGELPKDAFEERLAEMTLIGSMTNGPGTISVQGAKLSASAGNNPNTAMIGTLASLGLVHGGNGAKAVKFLIRCFENKEIPDPYTAVSVDIQEIAASVADAFKKEKLAAKTAGIEYERIPCLGHPVFRNDPVNYDPREQVIADFIRESGRENVFLSFYHHLAQALKDNGSTRNVMAVNLDAALACVWLSICWKRICDKQMTFARAIDIPFIAFALGRAAGGAGEYLDHKDFGTDMDMRVPPPECKALTSPRKLPGK